MMIDAAVAILATTPACGVHERAAARTCNISAFERPAATHFIYALHPEAVLQATAEDGCAAFAIGHSGGWPPTPPFRNKE